MSQIRNNIENLIRRKNDICVKTGRNPDEVKLIAVTKTRSADEINEAVSAGITDIGENKVQEIQDKYDKVLPVKWHMIVHLQTNKVKYIIDKVALIHSVDSYRLAEEINGRAVQHGIVMDILVQVNAAEEESKFGIGISEADAFIDSLTDFKNIRVRGLMTIAPFAEDPEEVRIYFRQMKELFDRYCGKDRKNIQFQYLSMGMTNDFEVAIEEGSNIIRVGTAIFGERNYF